MAPRKRHNLADSAGVRVMADRCTTCIFHPGNKMHLMAGRVRQMVSEAKSQPDGAGSIVCHDTLDDAEQAVCRGFFDTHKTPLLQVAERLGAIVQHQRERDAVQR